MSPYAHISQTLLVIWILRERLKFGRRGTRHRADSILFGGKIDGAAQINASNRRAAYRGEGPALVDITAGRVDIFIGNISAALRFEKSGQVKFLGLAARSRSPVAPLVPDAAEIGLPDLLASAWFGLVAPPGTPDAIVLKINKDTAAALKLDDVRTRFLEQGAEPQGQSPQATAAFIKEEEARWRAVIKSANVTLE
jgi:tripartite-type tricarboxylate transporter receptor subunit TctC